MSRGPHVFQTCIYCDFKSHWLVSTQGYGYHWGSVSLLVYCTSSAAVTWWWRHHSATVGVADSVLLAVIFFNFLNFFKVSQSQMYFLGHIVSAHLNLWLIKWLTTVVKWSVGHGVILSAVHQCIRTKNAPECQWSWMNWVFFDTDVVIDVTVSLVCMFRWHQTCGKVPSCVTLLRNGSTPTQQQRSFLPGFSNPFGGKSKKLVYTEQTLLG